MLLAGRGVGGKTALVSSILALFTVKETLWNITWINFAVFVVTLCFPPWNLGAFKSS